MPSGVYQHKPLTEITKNKISKAKVGKPRSLEIRQKISKSLKGHSVSDTTRKKISQVNKGNPAWNKGVPCSEETKRKLSKSLKGRIGYWLGKKKSPLSNKTKQKKSEAMNRIYAEHPELKENMSRIMKAKNIHRSVEERKNLSISHQGVKAWNWKGGITPVNKKIRNGLEFRLWRESVFARDNWTCQKCGQRGGELRPHHIFNFATYLDLRFAIDNGITLCGRCHIEFHKKYGTKNNTKEQLEEFLHN